MPGWRYTSTSRRGRCRSRGSPFVREVGVRSPRASHRNSKGEGEQACKQARRVLPTGRQTGERRHRRSKLIVFWGLRWRRRSESNRRMRVLQTLALPLGYVALRGRRVAGVVLERETGFEPATPTLARLCSTTELFPPRRAEDTHRPPHCQGDRRPSGAAVRGVFGRRRHPAQKASNAFRTSVYSHPPGPASRARTSKRQGPACGLRASHSAAARASRRRLAAPTAASAGP